MSHHKEDTIVCPNCNTQAFGNYCHQCGQETHLHKDTFAALLVHFVAHYFHYDSKFWQTMKALILRPGKLTKAYWNKQRMRYISPISLYIFLSAVFFLTVSLIGNKTSNKEDITPDFHEQTTIIKPVTSSVTTTQRLGWALKNAGDMLENKADKLNSNTNESIEFQDHFIHTLPKVFFFMIPIMGALLTLSFIRRKEIGFTSHLIFSLHFQSLLFFVMFLLTILPSFVLSNFIGFILCSSTFIYFIIAMRNVYAINLFMSIWRTIFILFTYSMILFLTIAVAVLLI